MSGMRRDSDGVAQEGLCNGRKPNILDEGMEIELNNKHMEELRVHRPQAGAGY